MSRRGNDKKDAFNDKYSIENFIDELNERIEKVTGFD